MKYNFRCRKCKKVLEIEHGMTEPHPTRHQDCGGEIVNLVEVPQIVYKTAGFFSTDMRIEMDPDDHI